ncbi:DUF4976 domain-containing protein [Zobellia laminariae]|nr:sulfatase/phosphatase domain-containing protein [Zobellia laminariae]WKX78623.1 DUF4976 domain-containing protein [Zobellia laminariae]
MPIVEKSKKDFKRDTVLIEHLWEFDHIPPSEGVRTKDWKYFRYVNDQSFEELYNLEDDPKEINNLAKDSKYAEKLAAFRNKTNSLILELSDDYSKGPSDLVIEWIRNTEGVTVIDTKPEFGWVVPDGAVSQSAYQILVASSKEKVNNNIGDVWDSEQIRTSASSEIEHGGTALKSGETYFWKVRIWDQDNRLSRYSQSQSFTMGNPKATITTPNSFQIDKIKPVKFEKKGETYFMDFGKAAFATLDFTYKAKVSDTLIFRIGEQLDGENINRTPFHRSHIRYQEIKMAVNPDQTEYQLQVQVDERNTRLRQGATTSKRFSGFDAV